jgi:hypothetical protein
MKRSIFQRMRYRRLVLFSISILALFTSMLPSQFIAVRAATVTIDLSTTNSFDLSILGAQPEDMAGTAVAVGDLNGDRIDDLVIGIPGFDGVSGQKFDSGEVRVFFGKPGFGGNIDLSGGGGDLRLLGADVSDFFGSNLAFIDVNTDGIKDLIIAAPGGDGTNNSRRDEGELYVLFGGRSLNTATIDFSITRPDLFIDGPRAGGQIGFALAAGDFNADGSDDLIIGAPGIAIDNRVGGPQTGAIFVVISTNIAPPMIIDLNNPDRSFVTIIGAANGDRFGTNVAVGDLNRDRQLDIIVTAPNSSGVTGSQMAGRMYVFYGPFTRGTVIDLSTTQASFTLFGPGVGSRLGEGLAVGDIDADQLDDIVVTAPGATGMNRPNSGQTFVYYGSTPLLGMRDLASSVADASFIGVNPGDQLGTGESVFIADIDKDNFKDVVIGAPNATNPGSRARNGQAFVLLKGGTRFEQRDLQIKPADITLLGARPLDRIGTEFAIGDINADGKLDLVIAAPFSGGPNNRTNAGMVFSVSNFNPNAPGNNQAPTINEIPGQRVPEQSTFTIDITALDTDSAVTLSLVRPPTPSFVTLQDLGGGRGRITIAPPTGSIGTFIVSVRATDDGNPPLSATRDFSLTVTPPAPVINQVVFDGKKTFTIVGTRFGSAPRVFINNVDRSSKIKGRSDTAITVKAKPAKIGLKPGDNQIQVIDSAGNISNTFVFRL